jgi:hypothetical protein
LLLDDVVVPLPTVDIVAARCLIAVKLSARVLLPSGPRSMGEELTACSSLVLDGDGCEFVRTCVVNLTTDDSSADPDVRRWGRTGLPRVGSSGSVAAPSLMPAVAWLGVALFPAVTPGAAPVGDSLRLIVPARERDNTRRSTGAAWDIDLINGGRFGCLGLLGGITVE